MNELQDKIRLGISSCLLGNMVRYDGGHKLDTFLVNTLGAYVEYVPVCPEVECGMSVPREALRLVGDPAAPRLVTVKTKKDYTEQMTAWARRRVRELEAEDLCGYIFKSRSPSSGMERVKVYSAEGGMPTHSGVGMFARAFMEYFPLLPVEEEGRLHDPVLRENFIERIFVLRRLRQAMQERKTVGGLVDFHTRHKLLIMSHSTKHYQLMGKLVAQAKAAGIAQAFATYHGLLMEALALKATVKKHTNVLQHMMGYFKNDLSADEKQELLEIIDNYRRELVPLVVPVTLINHYVRKYGQPYLRQQYYLNPHPIELKLRNHV
ncbi:MAG: DUF523 and DUF1722 domain-containing protein [Proteobacteria bacterium]|nr:DUF523 and DUF1722 domain-containing protein [Pseudomonadota bacterium]